MKRVLILAGYRLMWMICPPLPERLYDWYFDHVYAPWYAALPSACDHCPSCEECP